MNAVAVILCTWNRAPSLAVTLASLRAQRAPTGTRIEFIVVDNNSTDHTRPVVEAAQADWPIGQMHYRFEGRQGKQFALNAGIAMGHELGCDLLAFSDDDILFPTDWLIQVMSAFQSTSADLVGGRTDLAWPAGGPPPWYHSSMVAVFGEVNLGPQRLDPAPKTYAPAGANLIARRTLFERVGNFSETCFRHMDYEFGMRCVADGARVAYEPAIWVIAPVDANCVTRRYFRRWSFKAGISPWTEQKNDSPHLLGVPRWLYSQLLRDTARLLVQHLRSNDQAQAFTTELRIWRALGTFSSRWYSKLFEKQYPEWVKRHSQKKNNTY